jgi:hypothetical protein
MVTCWSLRLLNSWIPRDWHTGASKINVAYSIVPLCWIYGTEARRNTHHACMHEREACRATCMHEKLTTACTTHTAPDDRASTCQCHASIICVSAGGFCWPSSPFFFFWAKSSPFLQEPPSICVVTNGSELHAYACTHHILHVTTRPDETCTTGEVNFPECRKSGTRGRWPSPSA